MLKILSEAGGNNRSALGTSPPLAPEKSLMNRIVILLSCAVLISGLGCNEPGVIGLDVQPASDIVNGQFSDTTTLVAYTVEADSLLTWGQSANPPFTPILSLLGSYVDPVFGYSTASIYLKFAMPTNNVDFGTGYIPDSLVMSIDYVGFYGDAPIPQTVMLYQLTDDIDVGATYYTNQDFAFNLTDLGGTTINPAITDQSISIKLNDPIFTSADDSFGTNTDFQAFIKGFYLLTNAFEPGGMLYLDINSGTTKLTLYYDTTKSFDFTINSNSAWISRFHHNYAGTAIEAQLNDPSLGDSLVYIQPNQGVMVKVEMPNLTNWLDDGKIAVNKAELVLSVYDDGTLDTYNVPDKLFIIGAGTNSILPDPFEGDTYFGGSYDAATKTYSFNIARYIHELLYEGRANDGIFVFVPNNLLTSGSVVSANRVVLGGPGHSNLGMKLNLIYTRL